MILRIYMRVADIFAVVFCYHAGFRFPALYFWFLAHPSWLSLLNLSSFPYHCFGKVFLDRQERDDDEVEHLEGMQQHILPGALV